MTICISTPIDALIVINRHDFSFKFSFFFNSAIYPVFLCMVTFQSTLEDCGPTMVRGRGIFLSGLCAGWLITLGFKGWSALVRLLACSCSAWHVVSVVQLVAFF